MRSKKAAQASLPEDPREAILRHARSWLGVEYRHVGRSRRTGVDCAGLIILVTEAAGLGNYDGPNALNYPRQAPSPAGFLPEFEAAGHRIIPKEETLPGDVMLFWIDRHSKWIQHCGFATDHGILHTFSSLGKVVEHRMDNVWQRRHVVTLRSPALPDSWGGTVPNYWGKEPGLQG